MDSAEYEELLGKQLARAEELERRAWDGSDDVAYCLAWAANHRRMVEAARKRGLPE